MLSRFWQEQEGQALVEYGILVSLIALVTIAVVRARQESRQPVRDGQYEHQ